MIMENTTKKRIRAWLILLGILLFAGFGIWRAYTVFYLQKTTVLLEPVPFEKKIGFRGLVVYNEKAYPIQAGRVELDVNKIGQRIGVHQRVGTVHESEKLPHSLITTGVTDHLRTKLLESIYLQEPEKEPALPPLSEEELLPSEKLRIDFGEAPFVENEDRLLTNQAGVLKGNLDGYEEILSLDALQSIRYGDVNALLGNPAMIKPKNGVAMVDNLKYGLLLITDEPLPDPGATVEIRLQNDILHAEVLRFEEHDGHSLVAALLDHSFEAVFGNRILEGELVENSFGSFVVPETAVFQKDGIDGVYIKNDNAIVTFVPIGEWAKENDQIHIRMDETELRRYDEIFVHPSGVQEGDFIE